MSDASDERVRQSARPSPEVIREFPDRGTRWLLEDPRNVGDLLRMLDQASAELQWPAVSMFRNTEEINGMVTAAQAYEARGEARGLRRALLRVIENRFGSVPEDLETRISEADAATLEACPHRALEVASPNEFATGVA